jgi:hypothetical protein
MGSLAEVIATARDVIDRYGMHAALMMDGRAEDCRAAGDADGRAFWAHVAWAVRTMGAIGLLTCAIDLDTA